MARTTPVEAKTFSAVRSALRYSNLNGTPQRVTKGVFEYVILAHYYPECDHDGLRELARHIRQHPSKFASLSGDEYVFKADRDLPPPDGRPPELIAEKELECLRRHEAHKPPSYGLFMLTEEPSSVLPEASEAPKPRDKQAPAPRAAPLQLALACLAIADDHIQDPLDTKLCVQVINEGVEGGHGGELLRRMVDQGLIHINNESRVLLTGRGVETAKRYVSEHGDRLEPIIKRALEVTKATPSTGSKSSAATTTQTEVTAPTTHEAPPPAPPKTELEDPLETNPDLLALIMEIDFDAEFLAKVLKKRQRELARRQQSASTRASIRGKEPEPLSNPEPEQAVNPIVLPHKLELFAVELANHGAIQKRLRATLIGPISRDAFALTRSSSNAAAVARSICCQEGFIRKTVPRNKYTRAAKWSVPEAVLEQLEMAGIKPTITMAQIDAFLAAHGLLPPKN